MSLGLLATLGASLESFLASPETFRVLKTVSGALSQGKVHNISEAGAVSARHQPQSLLVLDASFNPPTKAHLSLASSALRDYLVPSSASEATGISSASTRNHFRPPYGIVFLFSVHNADKAPSPAAFPQRLAMMHEAALDFLSGLALPMQDNPPQPSLAVDIAVTKEPFYSDKSASIDDAEAYVSRFHGKAKHIHLIGHDTFVRFLNPKYYQDFDPPLSVLNPFFEKHGLRLTLRASSPQEAEEQRQSWEDLAQGNLASAGGRTEWAKKIEMVEGESDIVGVSSTAIRKACDEQNWAKVEELCPPRVAKWVRENGLYQRGVAGKM